MKFTKLIPNLFYEDIHVGLKLFVDCLEFNMVYDDLKADRPFCALAKDKLRIHLIQDEEYAVKDRPELRLETTNIDAVYKQVKNKFPELLHPHADVISSKPWGAKEFALKDESEMCVIIQQWD